MEAYQNFFNRCEHGRVIRNKYTNEYVYVECGKCPHCLVKRSDARRTLCDYEKSFRKYCYFITLTYNSQYVPKMSLRPIEDYVPEPLPQHETMFKTPLLMRLMTDSRVKKDVPNIYTEKCNQRYVQEHLRILEYEYQKQKTLQIPTFIGDRRPYILSTVPRFSKLHKFRDTYTEELVWMNPDLVEKLKIKNNTEGLSNGFPQFKGLLKYVNYRDYQLFFKRLRKYLYKKIGKYEKISSYVVSEYTPKTFRPHFHLLLFFDSNELAKNISQAVYQSWRLGRVDTQLARQQASSYLSNYVNSVVALPSLYTTTKFVRTSSRFSKLFGFESFSQGKETTRDYVDVLSNRIFFVCNGKKNEFNPPRSYISRVFPRIVPYGSQFLEQSECAYRAIRQVIQLFRRNEPFEKETPSNISRFIYYYVNYLYSHGHTFDTLPECVRNYLVLTRTCKEIGFFTERVKNKLCRPLYVYKNYRNMACEESYKLTLIDEFMSGISYRSLVRQLELQSEMYKKMEYSDDLNSLFYCNIPQKRVKNRYIDYWNRRNYEEVHYHRVKHKSLNDLNNVFLD